MTYRQLGHVVLSDCSSASTPQFAAVCMTARLGDARRSIHPITWANNLNDSQTERPA